MSAPIVLHVVYDGPDLEDVASLTGLAPHEVIALHQASVYPVQRVGFLPGFAYLGPVDPRLDVPRLDKPRPRVPRHAVGLAAGFTGVYPLASPGGWRLLGRMVGDPLFDPRRTPPARLSLGAEIVFRSVSLEEATALEALASPPVSPADRGPTPLLIVRAQGLATVQDGLLREHAAVGVPVGGPLDPEALRAANLAVGNQAADAAIELARGTLELSAAERTLVLSVNGARAIPLRSGERLTVSAPDAPVIVAVAGGLAVELLLGSRGTCLPGAFGGHDGRPLRRGDALAVAPPRRAPPVTRPIERPALATLEIIPASESPALGDRAWSTLLAGTYRLAHESDRVGARLDGPKIPRLSIAELSPRPMHRGAVQITHDGTPVVLGPDHPTTGGYPVIGTLTPASCALLGRLRVGGPVLFRRAKRA